ncbi:MAG: 3'-5' exonuclease [Sphaerochaetaceae bacterium]
MEKNINSKYELIENDKDLFLLQKKWEDEEITLIAMDFEGEFNLHVYGEHLCLVQLFDRKNYYLVDALKISKEALKVFLESNIQKIMFDCSSDSTLVRRESGIILKKIFDIRILAKAVGYYGNLAGLIVRNLKIENLDSNKKKKQMSNWMKRPLSPEQLLYALNDVKYLFDLKESLEQEIKDLPDKEIKAINWRMSNSGKPKHKDTLEWERLCSRRMSERTKIYLREYWFARDKIAQKRNRPASFIIDKKTLINMAQEENYKRVEFLTKKELNEFKEAENKIHQALTKI